MFTSISSNSTVPALLSLIKLSVEKGLNGKVREEAERILIRREEGLHNEVRDLKGEVNHLKKERNLLETLHNLAETEKMSMKEELKKRKVECEELSERVNRLIDEHKSLVYGKIKAQEMYRNELEEVKRKEAERMRTIVEDLKKKVKELEEGKMAEAERMKKMAEELKKKDKELEEVKRAEAEGMKKIGEELKKNINELEEVRRAEAQGMKTIADLKRKNQEMDEMFRNELEEVKRTEGERMKTLAAELKKKNHELEEVKKAEAEEMKMMEAELKRKDKEIEEFKSVEAERMKTIAELKRKNKEIEEEIKHYRGNFEQRISNVEEIAAGLLGKDVSDARKVNHHDNRNSCRCSTMLRSCSNSGGSHSSHRRNQDLFADVCDIDVCENPVIGSPIAAAVGPNTPIYIIDSDDESTADGSAVIPKTNGVNINSSLKETTSVNKKVPSVETGKKNGMKDSSIDLVYRRKPERSLGRCDQVNRSVVSREKTEDSGEIFHDDRGLFSNVVDSDSTLKEMPSVNTEEKNGVNQSFDLVHGKKTCLNSGGEANRSVLSSQKNQDNREFFDDDNGFLFIGCSTNGKSVPFGTEGNVTPRKRHLQERDGKYSNDQPSSRKRIHTDFSDCSSTDPDDGFNADCDIDNTLAKFRKKAWKSAEDLVSELEKNYELCMKAVCVLYRRTISDEKNLISIPATPGLSHFIAMGGNELAELLTKGDHKQRLKSSVAELKIKHPEALVRCRELAIHYNEKLFEIYRKGEDHFFCSAFL